MGSLKYVGKPVTADSDVVYRDYVSTIKSADLSADAIDQAINNGLSGYASTSYVDTRDALLATQTYIDTQDNLRLKLAQKGIANGVAQLDATAKAPVQLINAPMTQKWNRGPWSPAAYHSAPVSLTAETTLYTCGVTDPGYPYRLIVFGAVDATASLDTEYPIIYVRTGSVSGEIIAQGFGSLDGGAVGSPTFSTVGAHPYTIPNGATDLDVVALGAGGGGSNGGSFFGAPVDGSGGAAGAWSTVRLTRGVNLPVDTATLSATVGTAGAINGNGGASSVSGVGVTTLTAAGGGGGNASGLTGASPGTRTFNNNVYTGGATQPTAGGTGNPPGGGGAGGAGGFFSGDPGGPGSDGAVWIFPATRYSPVMLVPVVSQAVKTGPTTLYVRGLRSGAASTVTVGVHRPQLHVMAVEA